MLGQANIPVFIFKLSSNLLPRQLAYRWPYGIIQSSARSGNNRQPTEVPEK
jgi:hypothetical protein